MKAIIVTLLLLLSGTQACQQEQPERKITKDTVSGPTAGRNVNKPGGIALDTTTLDSQFIALRIAIQKGKFKAPEQSGSMMMMKRDTTIDTILDHDIIIALVTAYPPIWAPPLTPYIHIFEPEEGATVAPEVTVKFAIVDAPFRYDIDEIIFWIDGHWRVIDTDPGEYSITGLTSGTHTLMIELAPGPDYPDPVPAPDAVTFTIP